MEVAALIGAAFRRRGKGGYLLGTGEKKALPVRQFVAARRRTPSAHPPKAK